MSTEADLLSDIDPVLLRRGDPNVSEATSPLWVYVSGGMRGIAEFNFPAFEAATAQLRAYGYKVISPAEQDLGRGFDPTGLTGHEDLSAIGFDLRQALIADLNHIAYECDAICLLPGWENSKGARAELALATAVGLSAGTLASFASGTLFPAQDFADLLRTQDDIKHQFEAMTEHEYLTGSIAPALNDLVPQVWGNAYERAEKDRDAALARLDHCLTSAAGLGDLREHYDNTDMSAEIEKAVSPCSNCDDRKCMSCVFREPHDECRDDCPDCCSLTPTWAKMHESEVRITSETGGQKGKKLARFDLIPTQPLWSVAELYGYGTRKYEDRNWERGYAWSLSYAAMQRHANLFWSREDDDPETGLPHLAAVVFHALALMEYRTTRPEFDNRPEVCRAPAPTPRLIDGEC